MYNAVDSVSTQCLHPTQFRYGFASLLRFPLRSKYCGQVACVLPSKVYLP